MRLPTERKRAVVLPEVEREGEDAVAVNASCKSVIQESVGQDMLGGERRVEKRNT
jgi:hypothetical protein